MLVHYVHRNDTTPMTEIANACRLSEQRYAARRFGHQSSPKIIASVAVRRGQRGAAEKTDQTTVNTRSPKEKDDTGARTERDQ